MTGQKPKMTAFVFIHFEDSGNVPGVPALPRSHSPTCWRARVRASDCPFRTALNKKACQVIFLEHGAKIMGMNGLSAVMRRYLKLALDCACIILCSSAWMSCACRVPTPSLVMLEHEWYGRNMRRRKIRVHLFLFV